MSVREATAGLVASIRQLGEEHRKLAAQTRKLHRLVELLRYFDALEASRLAADTLALERKLGRHWLMRLVG